MNIRSALFAGGLGLLAFAASAVAQAAAPQNLFVCKDTGFIANRCVLTQKPLANPFTFAGKAEETDYVVQYQFPCTGHAVSIGLSAGGPMVTLTPGANGTISGVIGTDKLKTVDPDPTNTARLSFRPGCKLFITSVKATASNAAVERWSAEAATQIHIIELSQAIYLLSKDYEHITSFSRTKLQQLGTAVKDIPLDSVDFDTALSLRALTNVIDNALGAGGTIDSPLSQDALDGAQAAVGLLRLQLLDEIAKGQAINDRFRQAQRAVNELLAETIDKANAETQAP